MVLDAIPDPVRHVAHFHVTRGWGLANVLAALQAGIVRSESTLGGTGGQPANFFDGSPVAGTGRYYYQDPDNVGLVCTEDLVVMLDEMGIETGLDVDRILATGRMAERIAGRRLRSETIKSGRIAKAADGAVGNWAHRSKVESADADHPPKRCSALGTFDFRPDPIHCASSGSPFAWW
jgi:hydroxymethylglutaryl-CoA lyase